MRDTASFQVCHRSSPLRETRATACLLGHGGTYRGSATLVVTGASAARRRALADSDNWKKLAGSVRWPLAEPLLQVEVIYNFDSFAQFGHVRGRDCDPFVRSPLRVRARRARHALGRLSQVADLTARRSTARLASLCFTSTSKERTLYVQL